MDSYDKNFFYLGADAWPGGLGGSIDAQWVSRPRRRLAFRLIFAASVAAAGCAAIYLIMDERSPIYQTASLL